MNPFIHATVASPSVVVRPNASVPECVDNASRTRLVAAGRSGIHVRMAIPRKRCPGANSRVRPDRANPLSVISHESSRPASRPAVWRAVVASAALSLSPWVSHALDLNQATPAELRALKGLGEKTVAAVIQERLRGGPYASLEDLASRVRGVGLKKARALGQAGLTVGAGHTASGTPRRPIAPALTVPPRK